jgi:hypothetical protein
MTLEPAAPFGPYVFTLAPAEAEAAAARYGLRAALGGGLISRHQAPLAAFALMLLFTTILAVTGFISRRAAEITLLLAASAFMVQRLITHRRLWRARKSGRASIERLMSAGALTTTIGSDGVTQSSGATARRLEFTDCEEAEEAGGLIYLWPRSGAPVILPGRALADGEAAPLLALLRDRIRRLPAA